MLVRITAKQKALLLLIVACVLAFGAYALGAADYPTSLRAGRPDISLELRDTPASLPPRERVRWWLKANARRLWAAGRKWKISAAAIGDIVAYEALENPEPAFVAAFTRYSGPGKVHYESNRLFQGEPVSKEVEDLGYLPRRTVTQRRQILATDSGAIQYIGAILHAFSDVAARNGYVINCDPGILATLYSAWDLREFAGHLKYDRPTELRTNEAGSWVRANALLGTEFVQQASGSSCP